MLKKLVASILIVTLGMSIFVGCGSKTEDTSKEGKTDIKKEEQKKDDQVADQEFSYPIKGNKKLTYWVGLNSNVSQKSANLAETPLGKALSERTGVEIEYLHPAAGQEKEQFNLLVASGDYPDIVEHNLIKEYMGGPEKAILDGFIIDLTSYMPQYAPNLMKVYQDNPDLEKMAKTDTGKFYSFPFIRGGDSLMVFFGPIIRKDWLKQLNLDEPETMEDWYNMLKAFKDEKGAAAPLTYERTMIQDNLGAPFMGAYGIGKDFYLDDQGEVQFGSIQPEYKEFLQEFSKWYAEGLIDPDIETVDKKQVAAKITNGEAGASLGYQASRLGNWLKAKQDDDSYDLLGTKYPVKKAGDKPMFAQKDFPLPGTAAYVTTACDDIETAMRVLDYFYSEEGHMVANFGVEGESYDMINDYPTYQEHIINNPELPPSVGLGQYTRAAYNGPMVQDERYFEQYGFTFEQQQVANTNWQYSDVTKYRMPKVTPTPEESQELATIMNEINTYRDEMYVKYLFGQESLDTYDDYVDNIKKMGIERALEIQTAALERYNNR